MPAIAERIRPQSRRISERVRQLYIIVSGPRLVVFFSAQKGLRCCVQCRMCGVHVCSCVIKSVRVHVCVLVHNYDEA